MLDGLTDCSRPATAVQNGVCRVPEIGRYYLADHRRDVFSPHSHLDPAPTTSVKTASHGPLTLWLLLPLKKLLLNSALSRI